MQGLQGIQGTQGLQGMEGMQGMQGTQGIQGELGSQGIQGYFGTQGITGNQGVQGVQGVLGVQGVQGVLGVQGTQGTQGVQGTQGTQGLQGIQGTQGGQGTQGLQGVIGYTGSQGDDGVFVGPIAPINTEILWLDTLENALIPMIPLAGTTDQILAKASNNDYDLIWKDSPTLQVITDKGSSTNKPITIINTTSSTSTTTGALIIAGGVGIGGSLYVGNTSTFVGDIYPSVSNTYDLGSPERRFKSLYVSGNTIDIGGTRLSGGEGGEFRVNKAAITDLIISTGTNSGALIVTGGVGIGESVYIGNRLTVLSGLSSTGSIYNNALYVAGGVGIGSSLLVTGPAVFQNNVTFTGTATYIFTTNTVYTDNIIELHYPNMSGNTWSVDDGKDIGFRFHYYKDSDKNAALVLSNDTKYLEWYSSGIEDNTSTFSSGTYGTFKTGNIILSNTTASISTTTGALVIKGGVGIGGSLYVGNTSTFVGDILPSISDTYDLGSPTARFRTLYVSSSTIDLGGTRLSGGVDGAFSVSKAAITDSAESQSTNTGALTVVGGAGIGGNLYVGGVIYRNNISVGYGYTGSQGVQGTQGIQGTQGVQGTQGTQGVQGSLGLQGTTGNQGTIGSQGVTGSQGLLGTQGTQGVLGNQGTQGVLGEQGVQGVQGVLGTQGTQGTLGVIGYTGSTGTQGVIGYTGSTGTQGVIGYTGSKGESSFTYGSTPPVSPAVGDRWFDSLTGAETVWTDDGDTSQWVEVAASGFVGQTGYTGSAGTGGSGTGTGYTGSIGFTGSTGTQGVIGYTGSSGIGSRSTASGITSSLTSGTTGNIDLTGFKGYNLYKIEVTTASWVRIYSSTAARSSDTSRASGTDPASDAGVITEIITTGSKIVTLTPAVLGFNDENVPTTNVPIAVTNNSTATTAITVTLTMVKTEI